MLFLSLFIRIDFVDDAEPLQDPTIPTLLMNRLLMLTGYSESSGLHVLEVLPIGQTAEMNARIQVGWSFHSYARSRPPWRIVIV